MHTRALIATSEFVMAYWYVLLVALPLVAFFTIRYLIAPQPALPPRASTG